MKIAKLLSFSAFVTAVIATEQSVQAKVVEARPGTALFKQFRPVYHFQAREKWMNDPCAPYYDDKTGLYHMFYQLNPNSTLWGNMTWGHAVSKDQVTWKDYPNALTPFENQWDKLGVFSGFAMNHAINDQQTIFYTGVNALPISWKGPYLYGEHVLFATTKDNGKTWQKGTQPLIELPPAGLNVTGWRDPHPFHSKSLDTYFGYNTLSSSNYLIVAGGIKNVGPRIFLYHSENYHNWDFKGYLLAQDKNTSFSPYSANWGFNFEMTIYREVIDADGMIHNVMLFGAEGDSNRYSMWATGSIASSVDQIETETGLFTPLMVGVTDHSQWYANSIYTDKDGKNVVMGWITEDNGFKEGQPQGWDGILSLPRELGIAIVRDIFDENNHLNRRGDWIVSNSQAMACADGSSKQGHTIKTLGLKPHSNLQLLRNENAHEWNASIEVHRSSHVLKSIGSSFELMAEVHDFERGSKVGFDVRRSSDGTEVTTIVYDDTDKKVIIDRSKSSNGDCAVFQDNQVTPKSDSVWGYFYLYDLLGATPQEDVCQISRETLRFHIFVDVSSVEVFINDRFSLSARIYPCSDADGIALTASANATFESINVWTKPKHAWHEKRTI